MSDLEVRLTELGGDLDHPEASDLIDRVRTDLETRPSVSRVRERRRAWIVAALAVAATMTIIVMALNAHQVFDDGSHATQPDAGRGSATDRDTGTHTTKPPLTAPLTLADARSAVAFPIRIPTNTSPTTITIDPTIPGGAVTLDYPGYRLFELAAPPGPLSARFPDGGALITATTVRGQSGYWITGNHDVIEYRGRNGPIRERDAGQAGHVLMWSEDSATITVTGPTTLPVAMNIAATLA